MVVGVAAIMFFNLVDTFWVGQLGPMELAAMGFTFPVTMIVSNLNIGLSIGASAVIARAIGAQQQREVRRLTTDALLLSLAIVIVVSALFLWQLRPMFSMLGADEVTLPLIESYMRPWLFGISLVTIPMIGNGAVRATGDTRSPAVIMLVAGFINAILDPVLIFGLGPVPEMRLAGASLATIISYFFATATALYILHGREKMLSLKLAPPAVMLDSVRRILRVGLPASATNLLTPLSGAAVTRLVSEHGPAAVAAFGVGSRLESLSMIGIFALTAAITPFVGQNLGASQMGRIDACRRFCLRASFIWGVPVALLLIAFARPIAGLFNDEADVVDLTVAYMRIVPISYSGFAMAILLASIFNALNVPLRATTIAAVRLLVLALPLAYLGSHLAGIKGLFGGIAAANVTVGFVAFWMGRNYLKHLGDEAPAS